MMKFAASTAPSTPRNSIISLQSSQMTRSASYPVLSRMQSQTDSLTETSLNLPFTEKPNAEKTYELRKKARSVCAMVGIGFIVAVIFMLSFYLPEKKSFTRDNGGQSEELGLMNFNASSFHASITNSNDMVVASLHAGVRFDGSHRLKDRVKYTKSEIFYFDSGEVRLNISETSGSDSGDCWEVNWFGCLAEPFEDCFEMSGIHWYGGAELYNQGWPLEKTSIKMSPFTAGDIIAAHSAKDAKFGGVLEPFFVNSMGAGIHVDPAVNLSVSINERSSKRLCLRGGAKNGMGCNDKAASTLHYTVCSASNIKTVHELMRNKFIRRPKQAASFEVMSKPIWSTWAKFKQNVTQHDVINFADNITFHNFTASQIEIDDKYSGAYGDFDFDTRKFPNASEMIDYIHRKHIAVSVWVYPFANVNSKAFNDGLKYWISNGDNVPSIVRWWNGLGAILDVTNPQAAQWYQGRLASFQNQYNIDAFKFDAGEVEYLPKTPYQFAVKQKNKNYYSTLYVQMGSMFGSRCEVRVGYKTQDKPIFTRLLDRSSDWGQENGLKSVITAVLTLGIIGYSFILPDMIGGNAYASLYPSKELYIRWMQVNAFLPAMQFSIAPWDYDAETVVLAHQVLSLRATLMPYMQLLAHQVTVTGEPIIRPLWWHDPTDENCLISDTQFMLGEKYLIAPVIEPGQTDIHIYFPRGRWKEKFGAGNIVNVVESGISISYSVTLSDIPYFELLTA